MMKLLLGALALMLWAGTAGAATCSAVPFIFVNGQTADATQVNTNFNSIINCINTQLAPLANPTFTGTPSAPTATFGTNTTQIANTAFVQAAVPVSNNPTATAGPNAINGVAATFMRSDAAPAIQKGSALQFGVVAVDNATTTASGGIISAAATTVAGVTCTPGGSCAIPASGLSNGVTGTGAVVLASAGHLAGAGNIDDTSWTFSNILANSGVETACWSANSTTAQLEQVNSNTCVSSDERVKKNFAEDVPGLDFIEKLHPLTFDWLDPEQAKRDGRQVGLKAQAVEKLMPQIVVTGGDRDITLGDGTVKHIEGVKILDYAKLTVPLIEAVKQQQTEIRWLWAAVVLLLGCMVGVLLRRWA